MQNMWWEAFINKSLHLLSANNYLFYRSRCASLCGFEITHVAVSFCLPLLQFSYNSLMTDLDFDTDMRQTFLTLQVINLLINSAILHN